MFGKEIEPPYVGSYKEWSFSTGCYSLEKQREFEPPYVGSYKVGSYKEWGSSNDPGGRRNPVAGGAPIGYCG